MDPNSFLYGWSQLINWPMVPLALFFLSAAHLGVLVIMRVVKEDGRG